jgi:hypothetical protein
LFQMMPPLRQLLQNVRRHTGFDLHAGPLEEPKARGVDGRLQIGSKIHDVQQHLQSGVQDAVTAGRRDGKPEPTILVKYLDWGHAGGPAFSGSHEVGGGTGRVDFTPIAEAVQGYSRSRYKTA